jgi:hypothetical protein
MLDLINAISKLVAAIEKSLADGWDPYTDIPDLIAEAIRDFAPLLKNVKAP